MLQPKRTKFRRVQKGRNRGEAKEVAPLLLDLLDLKPWSQHGLLHARSKLHVSQLRVT